MKLVFGVAQGPQLAAYGADPGLDLLTFLLQVSQNMRASCSQDSGPAVPWLLGWPRWPSVFCHWSHALCEGPHTAFWPPPISSHPFSLASCVLWLWLLWGHVGPAWCCLLSAPAPGCVCTHKACTCLVCFLFPTGPSSEVQKEKADSPLEVSELWTHPPNTKPGTSLGRCQPVGILETYGQHPGMSDSRRP